MKNKYIKNMLILELTYSNENKINIFFVMFLFILYLVKNYIYIFKYDYAYLNKYDYKINFFYLFNIQH